MSDRKKLIDKHISADVTTLIHLLRRANNLVVVPLRDGDPHDANELLEKAVALSAPILDYEAAARAAGWAQVENGAWGTCPNSSGRFSSAQSLCEVENITPHEIPIIGHYIVTEWLADKLEARGERVERDFGGVIVWARKAFHRNVTCLDLDPVLLAIFKAEPQTILSSTYETLEQFNARREKRRAGQ